MRALEPDTVATVTRNGATISYEVFGSGPRTLVFLADPLVNGRAWKAQVPYLARHARCVVIDPRGNGRSSRLTDAKDYADTEFVADALAVMDDVGVASAVLVAMCTPVWSAILLAVEHPSRVNGIVAIAPWAPHLTAPLPWRIVEAAEPEKCEGWQKDSPAYHLFDYRGYLDSFSPNSSPNRIRPNSGRTASVGACSHRGRSRTPPRTARSVSAIELRRRHTSRASAARC
jgi:pimeloyl-ACP methyl ester carboxylesterase